MFNDKMSPIGFLGLTQVLQIVPVSKTTWWEGCKTGRLKRGEIPWVDLDPMIVERLKEIDAIREASDTKVVYDLDFAKAQVEKCYGLH